MAQLFLDEQLDARLLPALRKWVTAQRLADLWPDEVILDDRLPELLLTLKQPTLLTIDKGLWDKSLCHPGYAVPVCWLPQDEQGLLPELVRMLFRLPDFRTRAKRMGIVARMNKTGVEWWKHRVAGLQRVEWEAKGRR
jgi:hypothetical protein